MVASNDLAALLIDKGEDDPKLLLPYLSLPDIPHEMRYNQVVAWLLENTNPDCRFDLMGVAGTGLGWGESNTSWLGEGRLQFRWNVSRVISLYAEPSMTI